MKWHRNPFFHTAVLPPSVAPSAMPSVRPSADLDSATAAAVAAAAVRGGNSARPSTDVQRQPQPESDSSAAPTPLSPTAQQRVSFQEPRSSLQHPQPRTSLNLHQQQQRASFQLPPRLSGQYQHQQQHQNQHQHEHEHEHHTPHGILAEAANRVMHGGAKRARPKKVPKLTICEPSDHLTPYQAFYIFGLDGLGAFLLSGGINFAIGYAMYKTIDAVKHPIRLFQFPNTLAGDAALTIFIQSVLTWFIELVLVNRDLRSGHIQPIGFIREPSNALLRWFLLLDRHPPKPSAAASSSSNSDEEAGVGAGAGNADGMARPLSAPHDDNCQCEKHVEQYEPGSWKHWAVFLVSQLLRALIVGVVLFLLTWGPAIGIMTAIGDKHDGDWWFAGSSWAPPIFKLIYGGVLAALSTPPFAAFWLVRCGWALQANQRHLDAAATVESA